MPLTDTAIRNIKQGEKSIKLFNLRGLLLLVTPAGGKFDGKEKLLSLGVYPDSSLKTAQERRDESGDSNEIFPWIGDRLITEISAPELFTVVRRIENLGASPNNIHQP